MTLRDLACGIVDVALGALRPLGPGSLQPLIEHLGVDVHLTHLPSGTHGATLRGEDGHVVLVDAGASRARRRFTLAHELAHVMLDQGGVTEAFGRQLPVHTNAVERLCDATAAELLMPTAWMVNLARAGLPQTLGAAKVAQEVAGVSLTAMMVRLQTFGSNATLGSVEHLPGGWSLIYHIGPRAAWDADGDLSFLEELPQGLTVRTGPDGSGRWRRTEVHRTRSHALLWTCPHAPPAKGETQRSPAPYDCPHDQVPPIWLGEQTAPRARRAPHAAGLTERVV